MRIIGIKINKALPMVRKTLREGQWYPIGNFKEPSLGNGILRQRREPDTITDLYRLYADQPSVNVSCIVGKNGSGKSSLLDIMYRIINNLSFALMKKKSDNGRHLSFAYGLDADLYYEVDDKIGQVHTGFSEESVSITIVSYDKTKKVFYDYDRIMGDKDVYDDVLKTFFYTICTNYSIYSFNDADYKPAEYELDEEKMQLTPDWLGGLFHKNDGYQTPIVMTPYRENGIINFENEKFLANQRVRVLLLLFYSQGRSFIEGYEPARLHYSLRKDFKNEHESELRNSLTCLGIQSGDRFVQFLQSAWYHYIQETTRQFELSMNDSVMDMSLYYLAFKTLRICCKYDNFRDRVDFRGFEDQLSEGIYSLHQVENNLFKLFHSIIEDGSHISLKIRQCLYFIRSPFASSNGNASIQDILQGKSYHSYDEVQKLLPPSYYNVDIELTKRRRKADGNRSSWNQDTFLLSQLSSGEKHFLHSMSYALYHIKNLQSVNEDNYRVPFHHVNLVFDEAELYYHPEYQRRFVKRIIDYLHLCNIDRRKIRSVNVIIATHSPFILSDVLTENTLYLSNGYSRKVRQQTFGANIYDLLKSNFMLPISAIGDVAMKRLDEWIGLKVEGAEDPALSGYIGDRFIKSFYINSNEYVQDSEE